MKNKRILAVIAGAFIAASHWTAPAQTPPTADLSLWLKADAGVTLNGPAVAQWDDQSGQNHNANQSVGANQPTLVTTALGKLGLRFDGLNDFLMFTNNIDQLGGLSILIVTANNSAAQNGNTSYSDSPAIFWNELASWGWVFLSPFQTNVNWRIGSTIANNNERYARPASIGSGYTLTALVKAADVETLYVDKSLARTVSGKAFTTFGVREDGYIGKGQSTYFSGDIVEILVYSAALSDIDRQAAENYLYDKYLANPRPTVAITSPANFANFSAPANITITADATDNTTVTNVEFFVDGNSIGSDSTPPYSMAWNSVPGGAYGLTVKATDDQGAWTVSSRVVARVNFATPQQGPPLAGLGLWYKSDAGVTSAAGKVSAWADQSGFERHATQPIATAQAGLVTGGNGKPAVSFDGITNFMTFAMPMAGLNGLTIVAVVNNISPQTTGGGGEGSSILYWSEPPSPGWGGLNLGVFQDSATWRIGTTQAQTSTPNYPGPAVTRAASIQRDYTRNVLVKDGTSESLYTNGVLARTVTGKLATTASINENGASMGRGNTETYFRGEIQEILVYTNALTPTDLTNMDTYLTAKYWAKAQPTVSISSPADNTPMTTPASITVTANPADIDGTVTNLQFFDSGNLIGTVTSAPWQFTLSNPAQGAHTFTVKATDNDGLFNYSAPVMVFVKAASGFTLVENFENRSLGSIIYQGDWLGGFQQDKVVADTTTFVGSNANNKVLLQFKNNQSLAFPVLIPQGTTGTLFLRVASTTFSRESIMLGLSDARSYGIAANTDFEAQVVRLTGASLANKKIGVRDGGNQTTDLTNFLSDVWYKLWIVANNTTDTWKLYIQGGEYATPTAVLRSGSDTFSFRNGVANNPLIRFLLTTSDSTRSVGGFWVDDLYLADGENLTDPTRPTLTITRSGDNVIVSWPTSVTGVTLQTSASLAPPAWSDVVQTPVVAGNQMTVTLPIADAKFFSLRK